MLDNFLPIQAAFVVGESFCDLEITSPVLKTLFSRYLFLKINWLVADATAVGSVARAESKKWMILVVFLAN